MDDKLKTLNSTALQVNLERTAATVEIPEKYAHLLHVVEDHFGVSKRTHDLLLELNHPYVNWEYVLKELRTLSIGDFYEVNQHDEGLDALRTILGIYFDVIGSTASEAIKDTAIRYLFDYLATIIENSRDYLSRNLTLLPFLIDSLEAAYSSQAPLFRKASTYMKTVLTSIADKEVSLAIPSLARLLYDFFRETYLYWLAQPDPALWFSVESGGVEGSQAFAELVTPLSHANLRFLLTQLEGLESNGSANGELAARYVTMPDNSQILNGYFLVADNLERSPAFPGRQHIVKLDFLFNMMGVPGLSEMHNNLLQEINRCLRMVFREEGEGNLDDFVRKVFALLKRNTQPQYGGAVIDCITTLAKEVYDQKSHPLVDTMIEELVHFGFQRPEISGSTTDWQVKVNPVHIMNIRSWLGIIALRPRWAKRLLSALIINLKVGGVFVRDTDLLQKDISGLLNSDIQPAYNLVKQLLRIFPIYFTEIGAEGELRETSTKLDELSHRNDRLVYFLRKQSHVESNSLLVTFVEDVFRFWYSRDKVFIKNHLPQEVFDQIQAEGEYFEGLHTVFSVLFPKVHEEPREFLEWDITKIQREIQHIKGVPDRDRERAALIIRLYQLLYKKYNFLPIDLLKDLETTGIFSLAKIRSLKRHIHKKNYSQSLVIILGFLSVLKERILSPKKTTYFENIYHKRHIAAGIPSMYGTYQEEKFEAVGLSFRLENYATTLFEEMIQSLNLKFITKSTLTRIHKDLWLYVKALELEGIATEGLVAKMKYITSALQLKQFSVDQYIDIFQFISKGIRDIIKDHYIDSHSLNLPVIIRQIESTSGDKGTTDQDTNGEQQALYQVSENFFRSIIASSFGLQVLDNLVNAVIRTLKAELEKFKDNKQILNLMMAYTPELAISPIYKKTKHMDNQILIGNKGYFLKELAALSFPIPPGFIVTTEVFRSYDAVVGYKYIFNDMAHRIDNEVKKLEKVVGRKYGDPRNPLLLSVRSGATISLPGMMHSFLNVGINEEIAEGLSKKKGFEWAAWDSYRRYLQTYGMFQNLDRNFFDRIISDFKFKYNIDRKIQFNSEQMRQIALSYKQAMEERGIEVIDDPALQLQKAILQVFASWYSDQANIYRREMHLSNEWGTAVIVQAMIFGNLNEDSGSGVIFTRNPKGSSSEVALYGDFIFGVQGDDIVSGLVETYPISKSQRIAERRESPISLEERFPEIYRELVRLADLLIYEKGFHHQEIEFTFEAPTKDGLHILQTRDMTQTETKRLRIFRDNPDLRESFVGAGIGVSGGALSGRAVYSEEEIKHYRKSEPETKLILIRPDTVSEDVGIILQVDGILTAKGGGTSHAAVTIPQLNKVGVVGFNKLRVYETEGYSLIDGHTIKGGDLVSIDGWSGSVYLGTHETKSEEPFRISL